MLSPLVGCGVTQQKDEEQKEQNEQRGSGHGGKAGHQGPKQREEEETGGLSASFLPSTSEIRNFGTNLVILNNLRNRLEC